MTITLSPELEKKINERIESGKYTSANEVISEAFKVLEEQEELDRLKYEALKRDIEEGIESLENGEGIPAEQVFAEIRERHKMLRKTQ
ncbi:MAG: type II toxin-antitoxin system ParD family antitoxin [Acidobacteriota bacterium]